MTATWLVNAERVLRGRDLACWCPLDQPCHADVLLELANPRREVSAMPEIQRCGSCGGVINQQTGECRCSD